MLQGRQTPTENTGDYSGGPLGGKEARLPAAPATGRALSPVGHPAAAAWSVHPRQAGYRRLDTPPRVGWNG